MDSRQLCQGRTPTVCYLKEMPIFGSILLYATALFPVKSSSISTHFAMSHKASVHASAGESPLPMLATARYEGKNLYRNGSASVGHFPGGKIQELRRSGCCCIITTTGTTAALNAALGSHFHEAHH